MKRLVKFQTYRVQRLRTLLSLLSFIMLMLAGNSATACSLRPILTSLDSCTYFEFDGNNLIDSTGTFHLYGCLKYSWTFGDGSTATGRSVSHTYAGTGTYTVCMKITDTCKGCDTTICKTISTVCPSPCRLPTDWSKTDSCATIFLEGNHPVNMRGKPYTNPCLKYSWDFGGGKTATGRTAKHKYTSNGTYTICMKVEDTCKGCDTTICKTITISCITPCPGLPTGWISRDSCTKYSFEGLKSTSSMGIPYIDSCIKYSWDFGDGSTDSGRLVTHTYSHTGVYYVSMRVQDTCRGCDSTFYRTTYVTCGSPCMLTGTWTQTDSCGNYEFTGQADTTAPCPVYAWYFGDSTYAVGKTVKHSYTKTGTYVVCMAFRDTCGGCDTMICKTITVPCVSPPSSIKGIGKSAAHTLVYPNPASGSFTLNSSGTTSYKIFDAYGKMIVEGSFSDRIELSTKSMSSGIYVVQTNSEGRQEVQKLIIIQ